MYTNWYEQCKHNIPKDKGWYISLIEKLYKEIYPLRKKASDLDGWKTKAKKRFLQLNKVINLKNLQIKSLELKVNKLEEEVEYLKQKLEREGKTSSNIKEYLFGHGNNKKKIPSTMRKGGQVGHKKTNRRYINLPKKEISLDRCPDCGNEISKTDVFKERLLINIPIHMEVEKVIVKTQRQYCIKCRVEKRAIDPLFLPFTPYSINVFLMILILRYRTHLTSGSVCKLLNTLYPSLGMSKSEILSIERQSKMYLKSKYNILLDEVRRSNVTYSDETGWLIHGKGAWVWLLANEEITIYHAGISRGKREFEGLYGNSKSFNMHDGYGAYTNTMEKGKQMYCWSHILRFAYKEDEVSGKRLSKIFKGNKKEIEKVIELTTSEKLRERLKRQKEGLIRAFKYTDGTNNLAERELRSMVIARKLSFGSDTFKGFERYCTLASIVQTLKKKGNLIEDLRSSIKEGVYFNTS